MNDSPEDNKPTTGGPSMIGQASQWGMALVAYTCVLGFGGYFIGDRLMNSQYWALGLMAVGFFGGFSMAIYQIFRTSQQIDKTIPNRGKPLPDELYEDKGKWV
jgi:hypothetical protein